MRRIGQKLNSRRGATLIVALLLLLVASMVSVTILSSAVTAAKRLHDDRAREQDYLALSSAARLLKKELTSTHGYAVTIEELREDGSTQSIDFSSRVEPSPLGDALKDAVESAYRFGDAPPRSITVSAGYEASDGGLVELRTAKLTFAMKKESGDETLPYPIYGYITFADAAADDPNAPVIYLETTGMSVDGPRTETWTKEETDLEGNVITKQMSRITTSLNWAVSLTTRPPEWA